MPSSSVIASLADLCAVRVLLVSVSGFHQHLARRVDIAKRRHLSDEALLVHISAVYARIAAPMGGRASGVNCGRRHSRGQAAGSAFDAEARHSGPRQT